LTWSNGQGVALSLIVVLTGLPRITPFKPKGLHQPCHGAAGNIVALTLQLPPHLAHAIDAEVLLEHPLNFWLQGVIPSRSRRQPGRIGAPGSMRMVGRRGDRQHPADRLDPIRPAVIVDEGELTASFDGRFVTFAFGELDTLVPAYAATIHKSQGSEYPAVVIPVLTQHYAMLQRNLLYTGVTRGKRLVVLVGQRKAVAIAVKNVSGRRRWSKLNEWLGTSLLRALVSSRLALP
jgi:UvrD-like helicase C-terminal domain